ncbi:VanZ family protein [Paenibacillus foliorum]|uniref:VanZ family protein n=1 Tax=Paenibacillus foliorum TaxID=2654974 RepID=UPI001492FBB6|nr:VanZ family protein [Paenibacillus foliorum]
MGSHLLPIKAALITFPLIALLLTIPSLIYNYWRYAYVNVFRMILMYSFVLFMLTAYYLVILPLPETRDTCSQQLPGTKYYTLLLFTFVFDFMKETQVVWEDPSTYSKVLHERAFQQVVFNFILLLPLGVYIRYYFRRKWLVALGAGFLVSLFFEVTQLTGLYGIYNCPYRIFDVNDLLLNTSGVLAGYWIAPVLLFLFPRKEALDQHIDWGIKPVGYIHRMLAFLIDGWLIMWIVAGISIPNQFKLGKMAMLLEYPLTMFVVILGYSIALPYITNGCTFGLWLLRLRIAGNQPRLRFKEIIIRNGSLFYGYGGLSYLILSVVITEMDQNRYVAYTLFICFTIMQLVFVSHFVVVVFQRKRRFFYERLSETAVVRNLGIDT